MFFKSFAVVVAALTLASLGSANELSKDHLKESQELLYPFNPEDFQSEITNSNSQVKKNLDFDLPFYGFRYNYTRVSQNGYLEFTDPPETFTYPLKFPMDYPKEKDPAFIGPFYSKMRIGATAQTENQAELKNGVYFRVESNLNKRSDQKAQELKERVKADLRGDGIVGARTFEPKHVIIVTWKGMSFAGGIPSSLMITNTFQAVVATDESKTYTIFNYANITWTTHTEAGGDSVTGEGGYPAFVGFNAGQGSRAFEYHPYSQRFSIKDLTKTGCADGLKQRHIFKIDGKIVPGTCSGDMDYVCHLYMDQN